MLTLEQVDGKMAGRSYCRKLSTQEKVPWACHRILSADWEQTCSSLLAVVFFLAGPILGLVYVFILPFIGISVVVVISFGKVIGGVEGRAYKGAVFAWQPGEVYLAGKIGRARRTISRKEEEKKE